MYKDKHLQREANKQASQRRRDKQKGMTQGITNQGMTESNSGTSVIPGHKAVIEIYRQAVQDTSSPKRGCKYCGKELEYAVLECCYDCALKQPTKVSPAKDGHILASRPALEFTGELTDYEREHYKPASDLKPGQFNPVSKPGDDHYALSRTDSTKGAGV